LVGKPQVGKPPGDPADMDISMAKKKTADELAAEPSPSGEYTVLARRYRPQQFADLVGQEPVAQSLVNAIRSNRVAHAYLFTGARGVGKTSTARILAKALNCVKGPTGTPCDACDMCKAIATGEDIDVLEIDGASNRGIDEVREIRQNVQFRPSRARYKIYIIDEVHMLTGPAFNALLKTLEEPPGHVKFIFATTEAQKIPITILSRCQRFDFAGIGMAGIVERLKGIVASEGMAADPEALEIVARRAGGSMRDAQSLLDQLLAFGGDKLTAEDVHRLLGTANEERVASLASAVLAHDAKQALELLAQALEQGLQLGELLDQLIEYWRDLMVVNCAGLENQNLSVTGNRRILLKEQADRLSSESIMAGLDVLVSAKNRMRFSSHGPVLVEMALVRLSRLEDLVALSQLAHWVAGGGAPSTPAARPKLVSSQAVTGTDQSPPPLSSLSEKKKVGDSSAPSCPVALTRESLPEIWQQVLSQVGFILANQLRKASGLAIFGPNTLALRFPLAYNSAGEQYLDENRLAKVEETLTKIVGQPCFLRMEIDGPAPVDAVPQEPALADSAKRQRQRDRIAQLPLVGKAMDVLGGQIVQMDEEFGARVTAAETTTRGETEES
jgi:DNA polymerase-3 subunit gamma/tau